MNAAVDVMAVVMLLFFLAGVAVGYVVVTALSARRAARAEGGDLGPGRTGGGWPYRPPDEPDGDESDLPPWWQARSDV